MESRIPAGEASSSTQQQMRREDAAIESRLPDEKRSDAAQILSNS